MKKRGFTLIELLVVIAIIGILASMVLVALSGSRAKARDTKRKSDLRQIKTTLEVYYADQSPNSYVVSATAADVDTALADLETDGYIKEVPNDPDTATQGAYLYLGDASDFAVFANLENENDGERKLTNPDAGARPTDPIVYDYWVEND